MVLIENIWQKQELEPEPKLWTKVEPGPKTNNFGSATLVFIHIMTYFKHLVSGGHHFFCFLVAHDCDPAIVGQEQGMV